MKKVLAMPPPIRTASATSMRWSSTAILSETFAPPEMATNGRFGMLQRAAEEGQLLLHQEAGDGGQIMRDALGAGVRAVRRAEGVVDVDIAQRGKLPRKAGIVRLLFGMEAQVLQQQHLAGLERVRHAPRPPARRSPARAAPACRAARSAARRLGLQAVLRVHLALRPAQVAHQDRLPRRGRAGSGSSAARRGCACRR